MLIVYDPIASLDSDYLVWSIRAFYIFASYAILIVRFIPDLNRRFLDYGPRAANTEKKASVDSSLPRWVRIQFDPVLDWLAEMTVPHSWFTHFYVCSSICSAFWLYNLQFPRIVLQNMSRQAIASQQGRTTWCMVLLQIQSLRRLYECLFVSKASKSRMWIGHYLIGLAFYLVTNIAVWIELSEFAFRSQNHHLTNAAYNSDLNVAKTSEPSMIDVVNYARLIACIYFFAHSSLQQYKVHNYLASLKEYRVPDHPIFKVTNLVCPHYSYEVNIYLAFTIMTAQSTRILNVTMLCATVFVVVNLGVTADLTKRWQMQKFPKQRPEIAGRRRMLGSIW